MTPLLPFKDAAPRPGQASGAGVNGPNPSPESTRLDLAPPAHHEAPPGTSDVAALQIAGSTARQREAVLAAIENAGAAGATDTEIQAATGIWTQSISPRRGELCKLKLIVDSGRRRLTPRGRPATVWVASRFGPEPGEGGSR